MNRAELSRLARIGAQARLDALEAERESILRQFPDLRTAHNSHGAKRKGRRTMSAEARRRISEAQKQRWARQKRQTKK